MIYYILVFISVILFASQFLFNQEFQKQCGSSLTSALVFSVYTSAVGFVLMFAMSGFSMKVTPFSFVIALIYGAVNIIFSYCSIRAFEYVNLSVYSVFAMLGGMLLPSAYGIIFCGEDLNIFKILCFILILASLAITIQKGEKRGSSVYYGLVFVLNGLVGVLSKIHQSYPDRNIESADFMALTRLITAVICIVWLLIKDKKIKPVGFKATSYSAGFSVFCTIGNFLLLVALVHLPASVQYPIVTGGVMVCSTVISIIRHEKLTKKNYVSAILAFVATVFIIL